MDRLPPTSSPIRAVLFDAVGTLLEPCPDVAEVYFAAGRRWGSALSTAELRQRFGPALANAETSRSSVGAAPQSATAGQTDEAGERRRWKQVVAAVFDDIPAADQLRHDGLFDELWQHFAEPRHWRLFPDVEPTLAALAGLSQTLGIASNFDARLHQVVAGHTALAGLEHRFVSSEIGHAKPSPRFFAAVARRLHLPPQQILLIGDSVVHDFHAARAAGWQALLVDRAGAELIPARSDCVESFGSIVCLEQVLEIVQTVR